MYAYGYNLSANIIMFSKRYLRKKAASLKQITMTRYSSHTHEREPNDTKQREMKKKAHTHTHTTKLFLKLNFKLTVI